MLLADIHPNPDNPRVIKDEKSKKLVASIKDFPKMMALRPIVVDKDNIILGGNMRYKALESMGYEEIPEDWVKRADDLTDEERKRFIVEDNLPFGEWNWDSLANQFSVDELLEWGFDEKDLKIEREIEEDEAPEVSDEPAVSKLGEVYQLGRHRLVCGDAFNKEHRLLLTQNKQIALQLTDPPYGINVVGEDGHIGGGTKQTPVNTYAKVQNDDVILDLNPLLPLASNSIIWGGNYFADKLPRGGRWLVWDKDRNENLTFSDCELAWTNIKGIIVKRYKVRWDGYSREGEKKSALHPTMKSIQLLSSILKDYSQEDNLILDLFGGSGSTLIACEQTNRTCYCSEIDPRYVDVIRKRYAKFIGKEDQWQTITPVV